MGGQSCCVGDTRSAWTAIPDIRMRRVQMRLVCVVGTLRGCRQRNGELDLPCRGIESRDDGSVRVLIGVFNEENRSIGSDGVVLLAIRFLILPSLIAILIDTAEVAVATVGSRIVLTSEIDGSALVVPCGEKREFVRGT